MAIQEVKFGVHENVTYVTFGTGDIMMTPAADQPGDVDRMVVFSISDQPRKVGETEPQYLGKPTDEIPDVKIVFRFSDPHSVTALVQTLMAVQDEMFKKAKGQHESDKAA